MMIEHSLKELVIHAAAGQNAQATSEEVLMMTAPTALTLPAMADSIVQDCRSISNDHCGMCVRQAEAFCKVLPRVQQCRGT